MIKISGIMWNERKVGIALHKLKPGDNSFEITVTGKDGERLYPGVFNINREAVLAGQDIDIINKKGLHGVWVYLDKLERIA